MAALQRAVHVEIRRFESKPSGYLEQIWDRRKELLSLPDWCWGRWRPPINKQRFVAERQVQKF
eukprot:6183957-Pleurochrysis_carterae.AAC.3